LLEAIESGRIPKDLLTASLARQIDSLASNSKDSALAVKLNAVWGTLRVSPAEKLALMEQIRAIATPEALAKADSKRGKELFAKTCASCHRLFGEGAEIGPDLTGSGRKDLDYLITNIVDPGAVLAAEYRVSVVEMKDGRILSGVVQGKSNRGITVQTDKEKRLIPGEEISVIRSTNQSLMPEGLLGSLKANETLDLIKFLMAGTSAQ
jgi:putative heme-binding domain-containing protein